MAISVGSQAPNFDLSSTEDAVLMLRDEVVRTAIVLCFFDDAGSDTTRRILQVLDRRRDAFARRRARVLAVSPLKLEALRALQVELHLLFPLLTDDRGFTRTYGVLPPAEGAPAPPSLFLVDRRQVVRWLAHPLGALEPALAALDAALKALPSPTASYPRKVINRFIDRGVN